MKWPALLSRHSLIATAAVSLATQIAEPAHAQSQRPRQRHSQPEPQQPAQPQRDSSPQSSSKSDEAPRAEPAESRKTEAARISPVTFPDLVLLKDGGMLRGTIVELIPGETLVIVLATGETRRLSMHWVHYAGPADEAPARGAHSNAPAPTGPKQSPIPPTTNVDAPTRSPDTTKGSVRVDFEGVGPKDPVTFHLVTHELEGTVQAWGSFGAGLTVKAHSVKRLCQSPCTQELAKGSYAFALSSGDGEPVRAEGGFEITEPSAVHGEYHSNAGARAAGGVIIVGGIVAGTALMVASKNDCDPLESNCESFDLPLLIGGATVATLGAIAGIAMLMIDDSAEVSVRPLDASALGKPLSLAHPGRDALNEFGFFTGPALSVQAKF